MGQQFAILRLLTAIRTVGISFALLQRIGTKSSSVRIARCPARLCQVTSKPPVNHPLAASRLKLFQD